MGVESNKKKSGRINFRGIFHIKIAEKDIWPYPTILAWMEKRIENVFE
jgi:hypothetical protein